MKLALVLIILVALIALLVRLSEPRVAPTVRDPSFFGVSWDEPHAPRRDSTEKLNRLAERLTQGLLERADELESERAEQEPPDDDDRPWRSSDSNVDDVQAMFDGLQSDLHPDCLSVATTLISPPVTRAAVITPLVRNSAATRGLSTSAKTNEYSTSVPG